MEKNITKRKPRPVTRQWLACRVDLTSADIIKNIMRGHNVCLGRALDLLASHWAQLPDVKQD